MKKSIFPILGVGALLTSLLVAPIAAAVQSNAIEVYSLTPHDEKLVNVNKGLWEFDSPDPATTPDYERKLMQIYGLVGKEKEKFLFVDPRRLFYPDKEKRPHLVLLPLGKDDKRPLEAITVDFVATRLRGGAVMTGLFFFLIFGLTHAAAPAPSARGAGAP